MEGVCLWQSGNQRVDGTSWCRVEGDVEEDEECGGMEILRTRRDSTDTWGYLGSMRNNCPGQGEDQGVVAGTWYFAPAGRPLTTPPLRLCLGNHVDVLA